MRGLPKQDKKYMDKPGKSEDIAHYGSTHKTLHNLRLKSSC